MIVRHFMNVLVHILCKLDRFCEPDFVKYYVKEIVAYGGIVAMTTIYF